MKKRIKWENIISLIIGVTSVILYIIAMNKIDYNLEDINSYRLFWVINFAFIIINTANLLLWKSIRIYLERENNE